MGPAADVKKFQNCEAKQV